MPRRAAEDPMQHRFDRTRLFRTVFMAVFALALVACASVSVQGPAGPAATRLDPAFAQAQDLARQQATLEPVQRDDNRRSIEGLLAGLDDQTLSSNAAAL